MTKQAHCWYWVPPHPPLGLQTCLDFLMAQIQQSAENLP